MDLSPRAAVGLAALPSLSVCLSTPGMLIRCSLMSLAVAELLAVLWPCTATSFS